MCKKCVLLAAAGAAQERADQVYAPWQAGRLLLHTQVGAGRAGPGRAFVLFLVEGVGCGLAWPARALPSFSGFAGSLVFHPRCAEPSEKNSELQRRARQRARKSSIPASLPPSLSSICRFVAGNTKLIDWKNNVNL